MPRKSPIYHDIDGSVVQVCLLRDPKEPPNPKKLNLLECSCVHFMRAMPNRLNWCSHVAIAYQKDFDASVMDDPGNHKKIFLEGHISVPLMKNPPVVARVVVGAADEQLAAVHMDSTYCVGSPDERALGWITAGMGRWSIRPLIVEWLMEKSISLPKQCAAPQHFSNLDYIFDTTNSTHVADHFWRVTTGVCLWCHENDGVPEL